MNREESFPLNPIFSDCPEISEIMGHREPHTSMRRRHIDTTKDTLNLNASADLRDADCNESFVTAKDGESPVDHADHDVSKNQQDSDKEEAAESSQEDQSKHNSSAVNQTELNFSRYEEDQRTRWACDLPPKLASLLKAPLEQSNEDKAAILMDEREKIWRAVDHRIAQCQYDSAKGQAVQTIKIFSQITDFSIGTYEIEKAEDQVSAVKKYVPMFPNMYLRRQQDEEYVRPTEVGLYFNEKQDLRGNTVLPISCHLHQPKVKRQDDDGSEADFDQAILPRALQIEINTNNEDFIEQTGEYQKQFQEFINSQACQRVPESSESEIDKDSKSSKLETQFKMKPFDRKFQLDINFADYSSNVNHIPRIYFQEDEENQDGYYTLVVEMACPVRFFEHRQVQQAHKSKFVRVVSPLILENDLLNYWNMRQVIIIRGKIRPTFDRKLFHQLLEHQMVRSFKPLPEDICLNLLSFDEEDEEHDDSQAMQKADLLKKRLANIKKYGNDFTKAMSSLAMPLRLSVLALICSKRVHFLNQDLLELVNSLVTERNYTFKKQAEFQDKQSKEFWQNRDSPQDCHYKMYQLAIEHICQSSALNFEQISHKKLASLVTDALDSQIVKGEARHQVSDNNRLPQRRLYMTPTLKLVSPMQVEQSNGLLRELKGVCEYLIRVNILEDTQQQAWFNDHASKPLLHDFVRPAVENVNLMGIHFQFFNYSPSQIKQKSWWMFTVNALDQVPIAALKEALAQEAAAGLAEGGSRSSSKSEAEGSESSGGQPQPAVNQPKKKPEEKKAKDPTSSTLDILKDREGILSMVGRFKDKQELKKLARQGQSMSSSTGVGTFKDSDFVLIKDIEKGDFNFTDGSGYCSEEVMKKVCRLFKFERVSAVQMRFAGNKGVLSVHPGLGQVGPNGEKPVHLVFRESMQKFVGDLRELGVIRCSTYSPAFLNRQVILLLDYLGVPREVFREKNQNAMDNLSVSKTLNRLSRQAYEINQLNKSKKGSEDAMKVLMKSMKVFFGPSKQFNPIFVRAILMSNNFITQNTDGNRIKVNLNEEPIFTQILHNMVLGQGKQLKDKQRIRLPDAAVLIGIADLQGEVITSSGEKKLEFGDQQVFSNMLGEDEVFIQVEPSSFATAEKQNEVLLKRGLTKSLGIKQKEAASVGQLAGAMGETQIQLVSGPVLVTKNPCGHKGDIRLLKAIDKKHPAYEKLKHLVNVIVFPLTPDRPQQHKMSGGDLDGDVYMAIWDEKIVDAVLKRKEENERNGLEAYPEAAENDADALKAQHTQVIGETAGTKQHIADSICEYFERDMLGQMSNIHLRLAIEKAVDNSYAELASFLCSVQVDFAKHGRCINMKSMEEMRSKLDKEVPDFMMNDEHHMSGKLQQYKPDHVLQQLYEEVQLGDLFNDVMVSEHEFGILHHYNFAPFVLPLKCQLGKCTTHNLSEVCPDKIEDVLKLAPKLEKLFKKYVEPMEAELKQRLLIPYNIINEGELFCSDFKYRFSDEKSREFIGVLGKSNEDTLNDISRELDSIIKKYSDLFKKDLEKEKDDAVERFKKAKLEESKDHDETFTMEEDKKGEQQVKMAATQDLGRALYLASYFHLNHPQSREICKYVNDLLQSLQNKEKEGMQVDRVLEQRIKDFRNFEQGKRRAQLEWIRERNQDVYEFVRQAEDIQLEGFTDSNDQMINLENSLLIQDLQDRKRYLDTCRQAECHNTERLQLIWSFKKLFSVPWLIAYEQLLV